MLKIDFHAHSKDEHLEYYHQHSVCPFYTGLIYQKFLNLVQDIRIEFSNMVSNKKSLLPIK